MNRRRTTALSHLRGRLWRLMVLLAWVAVFSFNMAAAFDRPAQAAISAAEVQASLCHSGDAPAATATDQSAAGQSGDGHCALCHVFAAGILATPGQDQVAVLHPEGERGLPLAAMAAPAGAAAPVTLARPRAPPASV